MWFKCEIGKTREKNTSLLLHWFKNVTLLFCFMQIPFEKVWVVLVLWRVANKEKKTPQKSVCKKTLKMNCSSSTSSEIFEV